MPVHMLRFNGAEGEKALMVCDICGHTALIDKAYNYQTIVRGTPGADHAGSIDANLRVQLDWEETQVQYGDSQQSSPASGTRVSATLELEAEPRVH
jgi:hypothetical protein